MYDFIVIGSGVAGLYFSIKASKYGKVLIITKGNLDNSNTHYAQGGVAAVLSQKDSFRKHYKDTVKAGGKINNRRAVKHHVKNAPDFVRELINIGVDFESDNGELKLTKEGSHSERRIVYVGDITGKEIEKKLIKKVQSLKNIHILEKTFAVDLISDKIRVKGVLTLKDSLKYYYGKTVILATGGIGQLYSTTTNPSISTGDGIAMAKRAHAKIQDMEFIQFHPTKFFFQGKEPFLISETLRGEGGILRNIRGEAFMKNYHPDKELASRDIVSRAIYSEMKKHNSEYVYLDMTHLDSHFLKKRFPNIYKQCKKWNFDLTKKPIPVLPAAHYLCGGITTDLKGRTSIKGLYALGEVARTGLNGANRLASNSIMEGMVFGKNAVDTAVKYVKKTQFKPDNLELKYNIIKSNETKNKNKLRKLMWDNVGIIRTENDLWEALHEINKMHSLLNLHEYNINKDILELRNMLISAREIVKAAIKRKKSVGCHTRIN